MSGRKEAYPDGNPMTCAEVQPQAAGLALLAAEDPSRLAAFDHARHCGECARALLEGQRLGALLDALPDPPPPAPAVLHATLRAVEKEGPDFAAAMDRPHAMRKGSGLALATVAGFVLAIFLARHRLPLSRPWLDAAVLLLTATALAAGSLSWTFGAGAGVAVSVLAALFAVGEGSLSAALGSHCVLTELGTAALPIGVMLAFPQRRNHAPRRTHIAALGGAGALAGQAALLLTCHAHGLSHLTVFHAGGVALAALMGSCAWSQRRGLHPA